MEFSYPEIAKSIDHALLAPSLTTRELGEGCTLARAYDVASVCILPYFVKPAAEQLADSGVLTGTTLGFPHGGQSTSVKVREAVQALDDGARELDMVINISKAKSHDWDYVRSEIRELCEATHGRGQKLKVIFENCYLTDPEKIELCRICGELRVDWVKTSTGYGSSGASDEDLRLMRELSPAEVQVKAAGGVRTLSRLLEVRALGATRVGTSATRQILDECRQALGLPPVIAPNFGTSSAY